VTPRWFAALPLRVALFLGFAAVAVVAAAIVAATQTILTSRHMRAELREKSAHYGRLLQRQLEPVVAFDDHATAREILASFAADPEVAGLCVYDESGAPIEGVGVHPWRLAPDGAFEPLPGSHVLSIGTIRSKEGPRGQLFVSLSTDGVQRELLDGLKSSVATAAVALAVALLLARVVTRAITGRLRAIAVVAGRIADGDFRQPPLPCAVKDEIGALAGGFNVMVSEIGRLFDERHLLAETEQQRLEALVSSRTQELAESREQYRLIAESTNAIPFTLDLERGAFAYIGPQAEALLGFAEADWRRPGFLDEILPRARAGEARARLDRRDGASFEVECPVVAADGRAVALRWVVGAGGGRGGRALCGLMLDVTERKRLEAELYHAQKLESVGRLAAGVAHEINTPIQFVSDSLRFVRESIDDLTGLIGKLRAMRESVAAGASAQAVAAEAAAAEEEADLSYLVENLPKALDRSLEGLGRVRTIVRSMKAFAHPDQEEMAPVDLNHAIQDTLTIACNEYKYVADIETRFGALPPVTCHVGDVNQVVLNIVVNAAHAIEDVVKGSARRGLITVATRRDGDEVVLSIGDTGGGIPEAIRDRIFDPFFTTKEVGRGTGQGLAIARSVVIDKHGGSLTFESEVGRGTTFTIRLPLAGRVHELAGAAR